ncbi:MAG TPA: rhodanese-like domain-containing protein, partial [Desulfatiglandales bacterium]|nr:rhodanese-like domain-containing protein [Desulfatiglandales bacterium]
GAMNIARGLLEFQIDKKVPDKDAKIIVYCKSGGRGGLAAYTLCRMGYRNVSNMAGGWMAWKKARYPAE